MAATLSSGTDEIEFDFSQLDDTLINDQQKQSLIDYINQIKTQKRVIHDELNSFKASTASCLSSTGPYKRRRTKRSTVSNTFSGPLTAPSSNNNLQAMLETLIYIVQEMNLEQVKLTTTINQLSQRVHQNESYLNQLNSNIESLYEQVHMKQYSDFDIEPIVLPESSSSMIDEHSQEPIDMSATGQRFQPTLSIMENASKPADKSSLNKEYIELGEPAMGLSCLVLKRKYDQVRRRTELAYIHGEKRAIGRLLTFLIRQFFSNDELRNASLDGRVRNTQALAEDRMCVIDQHLQAIFGIDYNLYRVTKDCAEQVNVVCRHARNPKHFFEHQSSANNLTIPLEKTHPVEEEIVEDPPFDEYESFQEQLYIQANEQRFHELAREYDQVHQEVLKQREIENQLRTENDEIKIASAAFEEQLKSIQHNEQQLQTKLQTALEQLRQLSHETDQLKNIIDEKEKENYESQKQRELLEEENRQVHNTNTSTITRLQELESTSTQLQSLELLWNKERQLYIEQIQTLEQSLVETKKLAIDQQTQIMQLTVQLESTDGQLQSQKRSVDMGTDDKNETILNLDRQLREKTQRIEQLQTDLQRTVRQTENQQVNSNKTIQALKNQIEDLSKKNAMINEKYDEQSQMLIKVSAERDVFKVEMRALTELCEKQSMENEQTIRRLQDELDNTTQLLESIRSKGADLTQLTNFLDGTLSHIRASDASSTPTTSSITNCPECRQLKSALVLELTGKERFRFGYEQLSSMIKEAAPILRRQKQDYEASFEVIAKLTSELNEARKELSELHQMSGESIENYRYIQRENQFLINDSKSLATKIQVLLAEVEALRTGQRPSDREASPDHDPNQQVPLTFRNVVELQHVNQKLDKLVREMRAQSNHGDEDLNRTRFDELKKDHQQQQEKLKETKNELDSLQTQMTSLIQERDFLRLLVSRSSSSQSTSSTVQSPVDVHQIENLRDQVHRLQEKADQLTKKNSQLTTEKDDLLRASNEKVRTIQYELLTARTEIEQANDKLNLINEEQATHRLTIASLRTEINGWQERHTTLVQIRNKQEQQYFNVLTELRQLREEKNALECRLSALENERKFDSIKYEQIENECMLLKNEIVKNEQIQPVIEKLQNLAEHTKEKTKAMFEAKLNDLTVENEQLRQRIDQHERDRELLDRNNQTRLDELTQNLQQEKLQHTDLKTKFQAEKDKAEQAQRQFNELESKLHSNTHQKTDFEQQLGDYEKELKMLKVKLDAANNELELKQTLIQSSADNVHELNLNGQKAIEDLEKIKQEFAAKSSEYENEMERLKQEILRQQALIGDKEDALRSSDERMQTIDDQHQQELMQSNERYEQLLNEKNQLIESVQQIEQSLQENKELKEKISQLEITIEQQQIATDELQKRHNELTDEMVLLQSEHERLIGEIQQCQTAIAQKDEVLRVQQEVTQQLEERYAQLEEKHKEQHATMIKLSTHLAARESELITTTMTDDSTVNESWNAILAMNNYLRVENAHLTDDVERIRLDNAHINERNQTLEQNYLTDQETIEDFKSKNQSLQAVQERFDTDQQKIQQLQEQCRSIEQAKDTQQQENQRVRSQVEELNQQKQTLNNQLKQLEENRRSFEEQMNGKTKALEQQVRDMDTAKARVIKLEAESQELKQMNNKLKAIAIKYRASATAATASAAASTTANTPTTLTAPPDADEILTTGATEAPAAPVETEANKNRALPTDLTEKLNRLRDALVHARTSITTLQNRISQLTTELTKAKQSRISNDLTEVHALVDSIRQTYETEVNDLKQILSLFDTTDANEQMTEVLRLRKRVDELLANKPATTTASNTSTAKPSEDAVPKTTRPQAFASPMTQEPAISRVAPMAPASGRQIGVAIPMTASSTPTTTSAPSWAAPTTEAASAQVAAPMEHPAATAAPVQLTTPAAVNLFMKRTRPDDNDHKSNESTLKRSKPETETAPLIAHVEPQVREQQQQQQQVIIQDQQETIETTVIDPARTDPLSMPTEGELAHPSGGQSASGDPSTDTDPRSNVANTSSSIVVTTADLMATSTGMTTEAGNLANADQNNEQRRGDIAPIVYDVQSIPTIGGSGPLQPNRGGVGRQRPFLSISATRRTWAGRGPGGTRGGLGGRGAGGPGSAGPPPRP